MLRVQLDGLARPADVGEPVSRIPVLPRPIFGGTFGLMDSSMACSASVSNCRAASGCPASDAVSRAQPGAASVAVPIDRNHRQHVCAIERQPLGRNETLGIARTLPTASQRGAASPQRSMSVAIVSRSQSFGDTGPLPAITLATRRGGIHGGAWLGIENNGVSSSSVRIIRRASV